MIITTCPGEVHNGVWRHLKELDATTGLTNYVPLEELVKAPIPAGTTMVIMGGGLSEEYIRLSRVLKQEGIKVGLLYCSPFGQADINNETRFLTTSINSLGENLDYLFTGTVEMEMVLRKVLHPYGVKVFYLPQTLDHEAFLKRCAGDVPIVKGGIGLFCNNAPNKNILNQLMGARIRDGLVFTNVLKDRNHEWMANLIGLKYAQLGWMDDEGYLKAMRQCDAGLQCSWSEAFDYVVAEFLLLDKPILCSNMLTWVPECCMCVNVDSPTAISMGLDRIMDIRLPAGVLREYCIKELNDRAAKAKKVLSLFVQ